MSQVEADTYRQMAIYHQDPKSGLRLLKKAESALAKHTNAATMLINQESAQILRARVEAALKNDKQKVVDQSLARLRKLSESSNDKLIDVAYHGAAGAVAFAGGNYADAISHLEEDADNPLSLHLLAAAYQHAGNRAEAQSASEKLANLNDPTLEQALIVPSFRTCYNDPSCSANVKSGQAEQPQRRSHPFLL
jgi:tetratricopeptide (TPR) repeat protein